MASAKKRLPPSRSRVAAHPDREKIIKWLTDGQSPRTVSNKLTAMYPGEHEADLRISVHSLTDFREKQLNIKGKMLQDIKETKRTGNLWKKHNEEEEMIKESSAYRQAIEDMAAQEIDARKAMLQNYILINKRLEHFYNELDAKDRLDERNERVLQTYIEQTMKVVDQWKKYVDGHKDTTEHNVNITIAVDQVAILKEAVIETLSDVDPQFAIEFRERLNLKMKELTYRSVKPEETILYARALGDPNEE